MSGNIGYRRWSRRTYIILRKTLKLVDQAKAAENEATNRLKQAKVKLDKNQIAMKRRLNKIEREDLILSDQKPMDFFCNSYPILEEIDLGTKKAKRQWQSGKWFDRTPKKSPQTIDINGPMPNLQDLPCMWPNLNEYLEDAHKINMISCKHETPQNHTYQFSNLQEYYKHRQSKHKDFQCLACFRMFQKYDDLKNHWKKPVTHGVRERIKCPKCPKIFENWNDLANHIQISDGDFCKEKCPNSGCDFKCNDIVQLQNHLTNCTISRAVSKKHVFLVTTDQEVQELTPFIKTKLQNLQQNFRAKTGMKMNMESMTKGQNESLVLTVDGEIVGYVTFQRRYLKLLRFGQIIAYCLAVIHNHEYGILLSELKKHMTRQCIPETFVYARQNEIQFYKEMRFHFAQNTQVESQLDDHWAESKDLKLMSVRSEKFWDLRVPSNQLTKQYPTNRCSRRLRKRITKWESQNLIELLEFKKQLQFNKKMTSAKTEAKESDQEQTTNQTFNFLKRKLLIYSKKLMMDQCPFKPKWHHKEDFDAIQEDWSALISFVNCPFSMGNIFMTQAAIQFMKGYSSVMIIPTQSLKSVFCNGIIKGMGQVIHLPEIKFIGWKTPIICKISAVFLLRPELLDFIQNQRDLLNPKFKASAVQDEPGMKLDYQTEEIKKDIMKRLRSYKIPVEMAAKMANYGKDKANKVSKIGTQNN